MLSHKNVLRTLRHVSALNPLVVIDPSYTLSLWYGTVNNTIIFSTSTVMTATF